MKNLKHSIMVAASLIGMFTLIFGCAELNYNRAINAASFHSDGTDAGIEQTMIQYGFNIEALDPTEPSMVIKVKALFN